MKNKNVHTAVIAANIIAGGLFVTSFFISDNKKAVHRRWISLGVAAAAWGVQIVNTDFKSVKS